MNLFDPGHSKKKKLVKTSDQVISGYFCLCFFLLLLWIPRAQLQKYLISEFSYSNIQQCGSSF